MEEMCNLEIYKRKFENDGNAKNQFEIITLNSQKEIGALLNEVKAENPELILVDYDLAKPKNGLLIGVSGAALSTALREAQKWFINRSVWCRSFDSIKGRISSGPNSTFYKNRFPWNPKVKSQSIV